MDNIELWKSLDHDNMGPFMPTTRSPSSYIFSSLASANHHRSYENSQFFWSITHLSLSIHYRKGEGRWSSISSYSPMLWVCFRTNVIGYYVFHPSHHPSEGNLKFKQWSITSKPTTGSSNIERQLGYSTKYKETTSRSTSQCNALWRGGLGYFEATSIETCIPQVIKGGQKNSTQVLWSLQGVVEY